ncbi:unnamed protein product [Rhizophagus irregularis]|nr:unnamed protein product [Rhizophagus irregularis]
MRERNTAQEERDMAILAYNNERQESRRWMFSYQDKDRRGQILALQNNPLGNMADARRLPVLTMIAPILAKTKPYIGQEPPDDYLDRLIQLILEL